MNARIFLHLILICFLGSSLMFSCKTPEKGRRSKKVGKKEKVIPKEEKQLSPVDTTKAFYERMSQKLGIELNGSENPALLSAMHGWIGVPYKFGGTDKDGTDCSGLANALYLEVYNTSLKRRSIDIMNSSKSVKKENLKDGDFVFFAIGGKRVSHVGIYISNGNFIHASSSRGVMISNLGEAYFLRNFYGAGRLLK